MTGELVFAHEKFPHLSEEEWVAVQRMVESCGAQLVAHMLTNFPEAEQHKQLFTFIQRESKIGQIESKDRFDKLLRVNEQANQHLAQLSREQHRLQKEQFETIKKNKRETVRMDVSKFHGSESESLQRWLTELGLALHA